MAAGPQSSGAVQIFVEVPAIVLSTRPRFFGNFKFGGINLTTDPFARGPSLSTKGFLDLAGKGSSLSANPNLRQQGKVERVPLFLGWAEEAPRPQIDPAYLGQKSDSRGLMKDHDELYQGQSSEVLSVMLALWDENVLQAIMGFIPGRQPGIDAALDTGTLMVAENKTYQLWFRYPRALKSGYMRNANIPRGYHYLAARTGQVKRVPGTSPNKTLISWKCLAVPVLVSPNPQGTNYLTYNFDMSAVDNVPLTYNPPLPA